MIYEPKIKWTRHFQRRIDEAKYMALNASMYPPPYDPDLTTAQNKEIESIWRVAVIGNLPASMEVNQSSMKMKNPSDGLTNNTLIPLLFGEIVFGVITIVIFMVLLFGKTTCEHINN